MFTRRHFIAGTGAVLGSASVFSAESAKKPLLSFGLMADCQFADAEARGSRFYRESPRKLKEAIDELNRGELAFTFHLGDFIDHDFASFNVLEPVAAGLRSELFHALGNHDFEVGEGNLEKVLPRLDLERGYYHFRRDGFRFVVIDTTEVSAYRYPPGSAARDAALAELERLKAAGVSAAKPWNSRPGDEQIAWLEGELRAAAAAGEKVLLFGHHPIIPDDGHSVWNAARLHELFRDHSCAKVYINGHNHAGGYTEREGIHYLTLDGMIETQGSNAYARADLHADRLEITGYGRQESYSLVFR